MFDKIKNFIKKMGKKEQKQSQESSKNAAKERLHLVLMQDRANVSADFLELMKQEIIEVIKKYIEIDEKEIDVRLTNKENEDGTNGAPALYANIPILNIKNDARKLNNLDIEKKKEENKENQDIQIEKEVQDVKKQDNNAQINEKSIDNIENEDNNIDEELENDENISKKDNIKIENENLSEDKNLNIENEEIGLKSDDN